MFDNGAEKEEEKEMWEVCANNSTLFDASPREPVGQCDSPRSVAFSDIDGSAGDADDAAGEEEVAVALRRGEDGGSESGAVRSSSPFMVLSYGERGGNLQPQKTVDAAALMLEAEIRQLMDELMELRRKERERRCERYKKWRRSGRGRGTQPSSFFASSEGQAEGNEAQEDTKSSSDMMSDVVEDEIMAPDLMASDEAPFIETPSDTPVKEEACALRSEQGSDDNKARQPDGSVDDKRSVKTVKAGRKVDSKSPIDDESYFSASTRSDDGMFMGCYLMHLGKNVLRCGSSELGQRRCLDAMNSDDAPSVTASDGVVTSAQEVLGQLPNIAHVYSGPPSTDETGMVECVLDEGDAAERMAFRKKEFELICAEQRLSLRLEAYYKRLENESHYWQSNESAKCCLRCAKVFSFTVRKHHCRRCGVLLCNDCCSQVGRDVYAPQLNEGEATNMFFDGNRSDVPAAPISTTSSAPDNAWMFDTHNLAQGTYWRQSAVCGELGPQRANNAMFLAAQQPMQKNGALGVRSSPWSRICNRCYLICLHARMEKDYSDVLCDGRRRFHVLRDDEQSLKNINTAWETRVAQLGVMKHVVFERSTGLVRFQAQNIAKALKEWVVSWRHCAARDGGGVNGHAGSSSDGDSVLSSKIDSG